MEIVVHVRLAGRLPARVVTARVAGPMDSPYCALIPVVVALSLSCWIHSLVTGRCSSVDRLWSIVPPVYVAAVASAAGFADARLNLMTALAALWGARLTYNFARKGGYRPGEEDYRWAVVREVIGPRWFPAFNLLFIVGYQNALLYLLTAPADAAWVHRGGSLGAADLGLAGLFLLFLAGETIADQEQWRFHRRKRAAAERGVEIDPPFCTSGPFRFSRHPNFFCEISMWWVFYGFAVAASGVWLDWTIAGAVLLTLLFDGSTRFTERITLGKYPGYAEYQRRVSRIVPWWPRRG